MELWGDGAQTLRGAEWRLTALSRSEEELERAMPSLLVVVGWFVDERDCRNRWLLLRCR